MGEKAVEWEEGGSWGRECWVRAGTKDRGQRGRMYGHSLGNMTEKSEKVRGSENKLDAFFFSSPHRNAIEERRFIVAKPQ